MALEDIPSYFFANRPPSDPLSFQGRENRRKLTEALIAARAKQKIGNVGEGIYSAADSFANAAEQRQAEDEDRRSGADENAYMRNLYGRGAPQASAMAPGFQAPGPSAATPFSATASLEPWDPNNPNRGFIEAPQPAGAAVQAAMPAQAQGTPSFDTPENTFSDPMVGRAAKGDLNMQPLTNAARFNPVITNLNSGNSVIAGQLPTASFRAGGRAYGALPDVPDAPIAQQPPEAPIRLAGLGGVPARDTLGPAVPSPRDEIQPAPPVRMAQAPSADATAQLPSLSAIAGTMPPLGPAVPSPRDTIQAAPEPVRSGQPPPAAADTNLPPPLTTPIPEPSKPYLTEVRPEPVRPRPLPLSQAELNLGLERGMAERRFGPNSPAVQMLTQQMEHAKGVRQELEKQAQAEYEQQRSLREGELKLREQRKFDDPARSLKELNDLATLWKMRADASQRPIEREQALSNLAKTQVEISKLHQEMGTPETHTYEGQLYERPKGGGVGSPVSAVAGFPQGQKLNEDQSKTLGYFQRTHVASEQLGDKDKALAGLQDVAAGKVLPFPEYAQTPEYQRARNNAMAWIYAILRKESGAAIGKEEEEKYLRIFFPVPGNPPEVIADKAELRRTAERGLYDALGDAKHHADRFVAERAAARTATDRTDALEWLKNNPSDPRAPAIRQRLGL